MKNGKQRHYEKSTLRMTNPEAEEISALVEKEDAEARVRIFADNAIPAIKAGKVQVYDPAAKYSRKDEGKVFRKPEGYEAWPAEFPSMLLWGTSAKRTDFIAASGEMYSFTQGTPNNPAVRLAVKKNMTKPGYINEVL